MRLAPNMMLDTVDSLVCGRQAPLEKLRWDIERLFPSVNPIQATGAVAEIYEPREVGQPQIVTSVRMHTYAVAIVGTADKLGHALCDALLADLVGMVSTLPKGCQLIWRLFPVLEEFEESADPCMSIMQWERIRREAKEDGAFTLPPRPPIQQVAVLHTRFGVYGACGEEIDCRTHTTEGGQFYRLEDTE